MRRGWDATASLWPEGRGAYGWVHRAAPILTHDTPDTGAAVKRRRHGLLGAMGQPQAKAGSLAPAVRHLLKVSRSSWPGLLHGSTVPELPRTKNDLEQVFGAYRSHERRATGRKVASPAVVLRGAVRLVACAATRLRPVHKRSTRPCHGQGLASVAPHSGDPPPPAHAASALAPGAGDLSREA